jgi:hypothetical protein
MKSFQKSVSDCIFWVKTREFNKGSSMKKLLIVMALTLTTLQTAFAFPVNITGFIHPSRTYAEGRVHNFWARPMVCSGQAFSVTWMGYQQFRYFHNVVIFPGQFAFVNFATTVYDPFVNVRGFVNCFYR